jgi:His-Xaa-Ser repeat protein HxsA
MRKARFLISTLAAAGFGAVHPLQDALAKVAGPRVEGGDDPNAGKLFKLFKQDHGFTLAQHRSHRSHRSHVSHYSHRSGRGGGGYSPPVYTPAPPPPPSRAPAPTQGSSEKNRSSSALPPTVSPPATRATPPQSPPPLSGRTELFTSIVRRVQLGLLAYGYYDGPIDGTVGAKMKDTLRRFQTDFKIKVTGTITPEVLDALKVSTE